MKSITRKAWHAYKDLLLAYRGRFAPLPTPHKWVFIVGCYNSGTTLLHDLIATHPQVGSMPDEGHFLTDQLLQPKQVGLPRLWATRPELFYLGENDGNDVDLKRLKRQWGGAMNDPSRPVLIEKTPVNACRMKWLQTNFEEAHFVAIIRNGYGVAEGISRRAGHTLGEAALQWKVSNEILLRDLPDTRKHMLIAYEELAADPDTTLRNLIAFMGLATEHISVANKTWHIHYEPSQIHDMNARSLAVLSVDDRKTIEAVAGELLTKLGYRLEN